MKILIIKTSSLGDIIHSFPAIEHIKKNYPESRVDFLVDRTFLSTAKLNQSIDNFFSISLRETKNQSFVKRLKNPNEEINAPFENISYDFVIDFYSCKRYLNIVYAWQGEIYLILIRCKMSDLL